MKRVMNVILMLMVYVSTGWAVKVTTTPSNHQGTCPVKVRMNGSFKVLAPGPFRYQFIYSDGRRSPEYRKNIYTLGTHSVYSSRIFHHNFNGWVRLKVKTPLQTALSPRYRFHIKCTGQGGGHAKVQSVGITVPPPISPQCPAKIKIRATVRTNGPATVRYRFRRTDGVTTPIRIAHFLHGGNHPLQHTWTVTHSIDTKVRLEVLQPNPINSVYKRLKVRCRHGGGGNGGLLIKQLRIDPIPVLQRPCPTQVTTRGGFWHAPMTKVQFRFIRDDGKSSPWVTRSFTGAGYFKPHYTWHISHSLNTRVRLQVRAKPRIQVPGIHWKSYHSPKRTLRLHCTNPQGPLIGPMTLHASPSHYTGSCPRVIRFSGSIRLNRAGTVRYRFVRSDGAQSPVQMIHLSHAGTRHVQMDWVLNQSVADGWVRIKTLDPVVRFSPKAHFSLHCQNAQQGKVTHVYLQLAPTQFDGLCPVSLDIQGRFKTDGPATVRYRFIRSDGTVTPVKIKHVPHAGTYDVWSQWTIGSDTDGWVRLKILTPNVRFSPKVPFQIRCRPHNGNSQESSGNTENDIIIPVPLLPPGLYQPEHYEDNHGENALGENEQNAVGSQERDGGSQGGQNTVPSTDTGKKAAKGEKKSMTLTEEDRDGDGLDDEFEASLLERFRPYYLFAEGEKYLPSDPIYQLAHARILSSEYEEGTPALQMPRVLSKCDGNKSVKLAKLLKCTEPPADLLNTPRPTPFAVDLNESLRTDPGSGMSGDWDGAIALASGLYGHVVPFKEQIKLEYWQYFPYSENNDSAYEGDWQLLELWVDREGKKVRKVCHRFHQRKACFSMKGADRTPIGGLFYEYRGIDGNTTLPEIDPASTERMPQAYQNHAVRFMETSGEMHPLVYIEKGTHAFWPTPEGSIQGAGDHNGTGHHYLTALRGRAANLGELSRPLPSKDDPRAIILRFSGRWGAWHTPRTQPQYGPALHCDWQLLPKEAPLASELKKSCFF